MEAGALQAPAGLSRISISTPLLRLRSDEQLVALFRAGSEEAFQVIFDRYRQRLFAYTRQMLSGSRQDAEDALQDVFLRAYAALRANDRPVSLRAWLYRVAHNRCIDQLRRPTPAHADIFDMSRAPLRDPLQETERREDLRRLVEDVQRLPEAQRSALLMREIDGLSYQELAEALDVTVPAIKSLLVRARIGLVEAIEAREADCAEIREDLLSAFDRGVRASGRARRHLRDCAGCREYKAQLRAVREGFGALSPSPGPLALIAKLLGLGGAGGGAMAGGGAVLGGGSVAVVGGGAAAATACKVAAIVCSAALVTTAAGDLRGGSEPAGERGPSAGAATTGGERAGAAARAVLTERAAFALPAAGKAAATDQRAGKRARAAAATTFAPSAAVAAVSAAARSVPVSPNDAHYGAPASAPTRPASATDTGGTLAPTDDPDVAGEAPAVVKDDPGAPVALTTSTPSTTVGVGAGTSSAGAATPSGATTTTTTTTATVTATIAPAPASVGPAGGAPVVAGSVSAGAGPTTGAAAATPTTASP